MFLQSWLNDFKRWIIFTCVVIFTYVCYDVETPRNEFRRLNAESCFMRRCQKSTEVLPVLPMSYASLQVWDRNQNTCFFFRLNLRFVTFQKQNTNNVKIHLINLRFFDTIIPSIFLTPIRACIARRYCRLVMYCYNNWQFTPLPAALFRPFYHPSVALAPCCTSGFKKLAVLHCVGIKTWVLNYSKLSSLLYPVLADPTQHA